jgi:hypothetical protein
MKYLHKIVRRYTSFMPHFLHIIVVFCFALFALWLMFHTFSYNTKTHQMLMVPKVWSDFGAQIPLIRSFSLGNNWPPQYPLFSGQPIRYHFLFYFLVGLLEKMGFRIDWALNLPSAAGFFLLLTGIYLIAHELFHNKAVGILSAVFFLFNGNFSFIEFFRKHPLSITSFQDIISNTDFVSFAPWGKGDISAFWNLNIFTNQRHLALAFAGAILFVYLCLKIQKWRVVQQLPLALLSGCIIGIYPFFHQPTMIIFAVIMAVYFLFFPKLRIFLLCVGALTASLALPQLLFLTKGPKTLGWYPGYLIHDSLTIPHFLSYWLQNIGLHSLLIPAGFILASKYAKKTLLPLFFIFLVANLFRFSIEVAASHKFFNFALLMGNMFSAYLVVEYFRAIPFFRPKILLTPIFALIGSLLVISLVFSGIIDFTAVANDQYGTLNDLGANKTANWIAQNTPPEAIILNSTYFFHPASLAGRKIFMGWPYFAWSAGYDTYKRLDDMKSMYMATSMDTLCPMLKNNHITYVAYETRDTIQELKLTPTLFDQNFTLVYKNTDDSFRLYQTPGICL